MLKSGPYGPLFAALSPHDDLAASLAAHMETVARSGSVPRRLKELLAIMVSWLNVCVACAKSHEALARYVGVDQETLDDLERYTQSARFTDGERAALSAAVALTREPRALPPTLRDELSRHYTHGEVIEILSTIALYNYVTRLNNALNVGTLPGMQSC